MSYQTARERYGAYGVDTEAALHLAAETPISIHCWQGDDVAGFDGGSLSGGIAATGSYPGRARNFDELTADFAFAAGFIPGRKHVNLHASYAVRKDGDKAGRDALVFAHFEPWVAFAEKLDIGIDFNPTLFGHPLVKDGLTLSSPDAQIRAFWVEHCKCCRQIAEEIGKRLNTSVLNNIWIPDGMKDIPADRLSPRLRLKASLDAIFEQPLPHVIDSVESKVFGIGFESYVVGSNEFYTAYTASRKGVYNLLDNGHFHPTENTADKIAALLAFFDRMPLHITRPVRWDSDHVALFDDTTREIFSELVRSNALGKAIIGLDFFDASINRLAAWIIGTRGAQKALLYALLTPHDTLKLLQDAADFTSLLALHEELKTLPFGDVWEEYLNRQNVPMDFMSAVADYERDILSRRG
jgi:L-rhamnose isomerase